VDSYACVAKAKGLSKKGNYQTADKITSGFLNNILIAFLFEPL
jgi:hypothetical protein